MDQICLLLRSTDMATHVRANQPCGYTEKLYYNGALKSTRHSHSSDDAAGAKSLLSTQFPEYSSWITKYNHNTICSGDGWREPYGFGTMITLYVFEQPEESLKTQWSVDTNLDCCTWFGFKFMVGTPNVVMLKVPFYDTDGYYNQPTFPVNVYHYANIYSSDGTLYNKREAFMYEGGRATITQYCEDHGLSVPWGSMTDLKFKQWSVVYDSTTLVPEMVKCYVYE